MTTDYSVTVAGLLERWHPVVGYEDLYEVSNGGRVRRSGPSKDGRAKVGRVLRPAIASHGYATVVLWRDGVGHSWCLHRLVAAAWIGPCPVGHEVNHRNGIKGDNDVQNLEYVTCSDNHRHAYQTGLRHPTPPHVILARRADSPVEAGSPPKSGESGEEVSEPVAETPTRAAALLGAWERPDWIDTHGPLGDDPPPKGSR